MVTPPPSTDPGSIFPVCPGSGGGGRAPLQNSSSFQKSKNPKKPTQVSDVWKLEEFAQNPKKPKIPRVSKIQKSKNPNPSFGFLETRGICSKSKKPKIPRVSKNPKTPTPVFFGNSRNLIFGKKLEEFWVFLDFEQIPRVSNNPKLGLGFLDFWKLRFW